MTDQETAAQVRKAANEFNTAMEVADKAGLRVTWDADGDTLYQYDRITLGTITKLATF